MQEVSQHYLNGIADGRATLERDGSEHAAEHLANLTETCRGFDAQSPVGQYLRGERDFWRHQVKKLREQKI